MTAPVIVTRIGKGSPLTYEEVDANFVNLRDAADASSFDQISGDLTVSAGGVAAISAGVIVDADINASAQIAHSKLAPVAAGSVIMGDAGNTPTATAITGDITVSSSGIAAIGSGVVVDADISASAAIAHSKLASIPAGRVLLGDASNAATATALSGDVTVNSSGVTAIGSGVIVDADINASAAIVDTKLATIGTAGKVANSATTATSVNTANAIVARDANGDIAVNEVTAVSVNSESIQHPSATNPAIVLAADGTAATSVSSINGGPLAGFRNAIINGNFDVWQRGTSFSTVTYGADRWINAFVGSSCTMSRQAFTLGQTDVPGEPTYYCRMAVTSSAGVGNYVTLEQRIEGVRTFAGQEVTISFYAKADSSKPIAVELKQDFGTGGSPSSTVNAIGVTKTTLSSSWQKVTVTATVPSISSKTLGSDGNDYLRLNIWFDAGSDYNSRTDSLGQQSGTFDIAQVQVERGPVATPFERRPIGTELALCQRYFCKSYNVQTTPGTITNDGRVYTSNAAAGTGSIDVPFSFPVLMRANPTVVAYNPVTGTAGQARRGSSNVTAGVTGTGHRGASIGGGTTTADNLMFHFTADAEL